jgi:NADH-quinone oxidoreductase subunit M
MKNFIYIFLTLVYLLNTWNILKYIKNTNIKNKIVKGVINIYVFLIFLWSLNIGQMFDLSWPSYQNLIGSHKYWIDVQISFGLDGISLCFITLTSFIFAFLISYLIFDKTITINFIITCFIIEIFLILSFYTINLLLFYIFFESVLIPMFLMIIFWGSSKRRIKAAIYFLIYTLVGSISLLYAIIYIYNIIGTLNYIYISNDLFSTNEEIILWLAFFFPFAVKIPLFPFHIWLPEAHVEAPTIGSIILASLLLKLGGYGLIKFTYTYFSCANEYFLPLITMLSLVGILNASLSAIRQNDIKRVIAYSSIAHMNLIVLGIFSNNKYGLDGAIYLMLGHGLISTALFFCVGVLYDRYHTRLIQYYGGLLQIMPKFTTLLMLFMFANMGFPGTMNFIGEFLIFVGIFQNNFLAGIFASISTVLSAVYSIYLFNRLGCGTLKVYLDKSNLIDITISELYFLIILAILTIIFGIKGSIILQVLQFSSLIY